MKDIICWWSGGITSAVACKLAIDKYGADRCRIVFIDTKNEDQDLYRFKDDCAVWYNQEIETITSDVYGSIQEVWRKHLSLNVATGAICSYMLKRRVREKWEKTNNFSHQVFGFEDTKRERRRAESIALNHGHTNPLFPLIDAGMDKPDCLAFVSRAGLKVPRAYTLGFTCNNCLNTGCISAGISTWKKIQKEFPEKFDKMAAMEHELTDLKGKPVTMLKDQSNEAKESGVQLVFLKAHPDYPQHKTIDQMKGRKIKDPFECNGFCQTDGLERNPLEDEISFEDKNVVVHD